MLMFCLFQTRFCEHLKETENVSLIEGHLHSIARGLVSFAAHITENALALTLETLNILLTVSGNLAGDF